MQLVQNLSFNVLFKGYTLFKVLCTSHYTTASGDALSSVFFPAQSLLIFQPRTAQIHHILREIYFQFAGF